MNDEQIKQRIAYLVEHGGLFDDPLNEVRRTARWALGVAIGTLVLTAIDVLFFVGWPESPTELLGLYCAYRLSTCYNSQITNR